MENTENIPYSFLRKIEDEIYQKDEIPLIAGFYPLDIEALATYLASLLEIEHFSISTKNQSRFQKQEVLEGFSENTKIFPIMLSPLPSPVFLIVDEKDEKKLTNWILPTKGFQSKPLEDGFLLFILLNTLDSLEESGFLTGLSPKLTKALLPTEGLYIDLLLKKASSSITIRLCLSDLFRKSWNNHYAKSAPYRMSEELASITETDLFFMLGSVGLSEADFFNIHNGDFVALDKVYYDLDSQKGSLRIMLNNQCLFRAKIAENKIKLLDYSHHHEDLIMPEKENLPQQEAKPAAQKVTSVLDVPFEVSVVVAKISMPLSKLKEMQPGNYLPLSVTPEEGVMLTVNNKVIGRAELVYLGEKLGIRITEWGTKTPSN